MESTKQFHKNFENFDNRSKGFLTPDEYSKFINHVLSSYENGESIKIKLDEKLKVNGKVTLQDYLELNDTSSNNGEKAVESSVKILQLLKQLKDFKVLNDDDRRMIDWGINSILNKEIAQTELNRGSVSSSKSKCDTSLTRDQNSIYTELSPTALELLKSLDYLDFDIFAYEKAVGRENVLPTITYHVLKRNNLLSYINEKAFWTFIKKVQAGYNPNPYHNDLHASDVVQLCNFLLYNDVKEIGRLNDIDILSLIIAAATHDIKHPSVNNNYIIGAKTDLALIYNDQSVLENFHLSETFRLLWRDKDCDMFKKLTTSERNILRKRITGIIYATDNSKHFDYLSWLERMIKVNGISKGKNAEKIINNTNEFKSKQELLAVCLHLADISNPTRAFKIAQNWGKRIAEEFYNQGDREKAGGLAVSPGFDRRTGNLPKLQIGFASAMVKPYVEKVVEVFPKLQVMIDNINYGQEEWKKLEKELELQGTSSN